MQSFFRNGQWSRNISDDTATVSLGIVLSLGLFLLAPVIGFLLTTQGFSTILSVGIGVGIATGGYIVCVLALDRYVLGSLVALLVTSTIGANVPLIANVYQYPGHTGPQLWLVHVPLLVLVSLFAYKRWYPSLRPTRTEILFGAFVVWTIVSAVFADSPRPDAALLFAFFFLQAWLVFSIVSRSVRKGIISTRAVILVGIIAVAGNTFVAVVQFLSGGPGGPIGFSFLGASARPPTGTVLLGPLGGMHVGPYITGFTAGGFNSLVLLFAFPLLGFTIATRGVRRVIGIAVFLIMAAMLRVGASDSARGSFFVATGLFVCGFALLYRRRSKAHGKTIRESVADAFPAVLRSVTSVAFMLSGSLLAILYPLSKSGGQSDSTTGAVAENVTASNSSVNGSTTATTGSTPPTPTNASSASAISDVSVPFFNISNLSIRLKQYVAGMDIFLQHPLFGVGAGNAYYLLPSYGLPRRFRIHNIYIDLLAGTGIIGFVLYMGAVAIGLWRSIKLVSLSSTDQYLLLGVCCGLLGVLANGFWLPALDKIPRLFPFWAVLGALIGGYARTKRAE